MPRSHAALLGARCLLQAPPRPCTRKANALSALTLPYRATVSEAELYNTKSFQCSIESSHTGPLLPAHMHKVPCTSL